MTAPNVEVLHSDKVIDIATASNYKDFKVRHFHLDLDVRFESQTIVGAIILDIEIDRPCVEVVLDSHDTLQIHKVIQKPNGESLAFDVKPFASYGTALHIPTKCSVGDKFQLEINYTATHGPGVVWLAPVQTAGKQHPFMYTQGQAVCNRSFFPCTDTPAVKSTYSANVKVPNGFTAVMSAEKCEKGEADTIFKFEMTNPIPPYLVAMAVGDIVSADIGPRSKVWAEPAMVDKAKSEFDGVVEEYITTGETLFGPYVWGRYDLLVLPPSYPFGGMENPCLTFVTPCIVVGDKSLTDVVMHEIAHSWFGNLVTNATWSEFWLNEGFTMYAQRRISMKVMGESYTCLEAATGRSLLRLHMDSSGEDHPLNRLRVVIDEGVDPDDTYNETPYEKGFCFCSYLKSLAGGYDKFDEFLRAYVQKYKFKSIVSEDLFDFFLDYFPDLKDQDVSNSKNLEFDRWLNTPGWPPYLPDLSAGEELTRPAELLAAVWAGEDAQTTSKDITDWPVYQVLHFLDQLLNRPRLPDGAIEQLDNEYPHLSKSNNAEIQLRWSQIVLKNDHKPHFAGIRSFLESQGKQKYTLPIYRAMKQGSNEAQQMAFQVFNSTKDQLHINVQNYVEKILNS